MPIIQSQHVCIIGRMAISKDNGIFVAAASNRRTDPRRQDAAATRIWRLGGIGIIANSRSAIRLSTIA